MLFDNHSSLGLFPSQHPTQTTTFMIPMNQTPSPSNSQYEFQFKATPRRKTSGESDYSDFLETSSNQSTRASHLSGSSKKILKKHLNTESQLQTPKSGLRTRNSWTEQEDEQVLELIKVHGPKWTKVALIMGGRTGKQVRDRYLNVLTPHINKASWSQEEDKIIISMYQQFGAQWRRISEYLKGRTETQVKNRYYTNLKKRVGELEEEAGTEINFLESFENSSEVFTEQSPCKFIDMSESFFDMEKTKISSGYHTSRSSESFEFGLENSVLSFLGSEMISYKAEERGYDDSCFDL